MDLRSGVRGKKAKAEESSGARAGVRTTLNTHSPACPRSLREKTDVSLFGYSPGD